MYDKIRVFHCRHIVLFRVYSLSQPWYKSLNIKLEFSCWNEYWNWRLTHSNIQLPKTENGSGEIWVTTLHNSSLSLIAFHTVRFIQGLLSSYWTQREGKSENLWKEAAMSQFQARPNILLAWQRKRSKFLSLNSRSLGGYTNNDFAEWEPVKLIKRQ
jgi:hypothetical protein